MDALLQDVKFALRSLRRTPGLALIVVVVMALGIAVNSMSYSALRALMFADLPFPDVDRIVRVERVDLQEPGHDASMSMPDARDVRDQSRTLASVAMYDETSAYLAAGDSPQRFFATFGSEHLLDALGVRPILGRWFTREECAMGENLVPVVLGHRIWREQYKSDPDVVGRTLAMNGRVRTIVGVMPEFFRFPAVSDLFIPMAMNDTTDTRELRYLSVVARLAPGAKLDGARAELQQIAGAIAK